MDVTERDGAVYLKIFKMVLDAEVITNTLTCRSERKDVRHSSTSVQLPSQVLGVHCPCQKRRERRNKTQMT